MRHYISSLLLVSSALLSAQTDTDSYSSPQNFGDRIIIGTSLTYIPASNEFDEYTYHELTWHKNIAVYVGYNLYAGIQHLNIYTSGSVLFGVDDRRENYYMAGAFLQYDLLKKYKARIYPEVSYNIGNLCNCGNGDSYRVENLQYLGWGGGADYPITNWLSIEAGLHFYLIIQKQPVEKYGFSQYILGLNIDIAR